MPKKTLAGLMVGAALLLVLPSAVPAAQNGARPGPKAGPELDLPLPVADLPTAVVLAEGFDDVTTLPGAGWSLQNNSSPLGVSDWFQGNPDVFNAHAGATSAYIGANYNNTGSVGTISNWLISPVFDFTTVGRCLFYTRTATGSTWADRLELRYSTAGASTNTGGTATSVGDFTNNPLTINPTLVGNGYPQSWTEFSVDFPASGSGRLALRYFVTDAGGSGTNSNYIGIDTLVCQDRQPAPVAGAATLVAESCAAANGALDPGETVTVSLCIENTGFADTVALLGSLAASGGVENPSAPQSFGVVPVGGAPVCRDFTFNVDLGLACGADVVATLELQDGAAGFPDLTYTFTTGALASTTTTFSNGTAFTIPSSGNASLYPSAITSSGMTGVITDVDVTITGLNHTWPDDVDLLLQGPGGALALRSDAGSLTDLVNVTYTVDDQAAALFQDSALDPSGSYRPTNYGTGDNFPAPGPGTTYSNPATAGAATLASVFTGQSPNGTWNLYVVDDSSGDSGSVSGGWSVTISAAAPVCCTAACAVTAPAPVAAGNDLGVCQAAVVYPPPTVAGICGTVACAPPPGGVFPVGTTTVTCDPEAAGADATFGVTVSDVEPPVQGACPADVLVQVDAGVTSTPVEFIAPSATDNCAATTACSPDSGALFPLGTTTVACVSVDAAGNSASCTFDVAVVAAAPVIQEIPAASTLGLAALALLLGGAAFVALRRGA